MSFGIRKAFVPDESGVGIVPVMLAPTTEGETLQGQFLNERTIRKLKYSEPELKDLDKAKLNPDMVRLLYDLMDRTKMSDEMKELWEELMYSANTESESDEDEENEEVEMAASESSGSETESEDDTTVVEATFE